MQCSGVEWNGCILGHFGSFGSLFVIFGYFSRQHNAKSKKQTPSSAAYPTSLNISFFSILRCFDQTVTKNDKKCAK